MQGLASMQGLMHLFWPHLGAGTFWGVGVSTWYNQSVSIKGLVYVCFFLQFTSYKWRPVVYLIRTKRPKKTFQCTKSILQKSNLNISTAKTLNCSIFIEVAIYWVHNKVWVLFNSENRLILNNNCCFPPDIHCVSDGTGEDPDAGQRQSVWPRLSLVWPRLGLVWPRLSLTKNLPRCADRQTSQEQCPTSPDLLDLGGSSEGSESLQLARFLPSQSTSAPTNWLWG